MNEVAEVVKNILSAIYKGFFSSLVLAAVFMLAYIGAKELGWKQMFKKWFYDFGHNKEFRRTFFLAFYTAMILFNTLLGRSYWASSLGNVFGKWALYTPGIGINVDGVINILFFIPFIFMLFWIYGNRIFKRENIRFIDAVVKAVIITFCISGSIEFAQLVFKLGTVQLSDLVYNTLGGVIGGIIYYLYYRIKNR